MPSYEAEERVHRILFARDLIGPPCKSYGSQRRSTYNELRVPPEDQLWPRTTSELVIPPHTSHTSMVIGLDVETSRPEDADVQAQLDIVRDRIAGESVLTIAEWVPLPGARMRAVLGPQVPRVEAMLEPWVAAEITRRRWKPDAWACSVEIHPQWNRRAYLRASIAIDPERLSDEIEDDADRAVDAAFPELKGLLRVVTGPYR